MSETPNISAEDIRPQASDVRFGMRGLLLTMTGVAVCAAVVGSSLRELRPGELQVVLVALVLWSVLILGRIGYCAYLRLRVERMAGRTICVPAPRGVFGFARKPWMTVVIGSLWIGGGLYFLAINSLASGNPARTGELQTSDFLTSI